MTGQQQESTKIRNNKKDWSKNMCYLPYLTGRRRVHTTTAGSGTPAGRLPPLRGWAGRRSGGLPEWTPKGREVKLGLRLPLNHQERNRWPVWLTRVIVVVFCWHSMKGVVFMGIQKIGYIITFAWILRVVYIDIQKIGYIITLVWIIKDNWIKRGIWGSLSYNNVKIL